MDLARRRDVVVRLLYRPGHFIICNCPVALVWPRDRADDALARELNATLVLGPQRTHEQDVEFGINQLVELAVRALSPGINAPFTAINCIDRLGTALIRLSERKIPSPYCYDDKGNLRVVANPFSLAGMVDAAFNQIRQHGRSDVAVTIRLLDTIARVAERTSDSRLHDHLKAHAQHVEESSRRANLSDLDQKAITRRYQAALEIIAAAGRPPADGDR